MTSSALQHKFEVKKFLKGFFLWLLCIPINFVPIFMLYVNRIQTNGYTTVGQLLIDVVNDIDFMFIFVAVLFVLPLQGLFADYGDSGLQSAGKTCSVACYFCSSFLLIIYVLCSANSSADALLYAKFSLTFNITIAALTVVAGIALHVLMSIKTKGEEQET